MTPSKTVKLSRPPSHDGKVAMPRVFLATPCYGGMCTMHFAQGLAMTLLAMDKSGVKYQLWMEGNESLITRARNKAVAEFLKGDCTHLMFIDADLSFRPKDVATLVQSGLDVACGAYPMKTVGWQAVADAAKEGRPPEHLMELGALYAVNPHWKDMAGTEIDVLVKNDARFIEVQDAATGFMCIRREVLERMVREMGEELAYTTDYPPVGVTHHAVFETMIDPESKRYLSEDYAFCRRWQQLGGKVHLCLDVDLGHVGSYQFRGQVGRLFAEYTPGAANVTADPEPVAPPAKSEARIAVTQPAPAGPRPKAGAFVERPDLEERAEAVEDEDDMPVEFVTTNAAAG